MISYILSDIEGTTTSITFVHDVLFPYAYERLPEFVRKNRGDETVEQCLADTKATIKTEEGKIASDDEAIATLLKWIKDDRKHSALKTLQGLIWEDGYTSKAYTSDLYDDVVPCMKAWIDAGKKVGIYSSGSVHAQKLLFGHTPKGDITPMLSDYFDTAVGGKREKDSYTKIATALKCAPNQVLFLSDVEQELEAAAAAGMKGMLLVRDGKSPNSQFPICRDFNDVNTAMEKL